MNKNDFINKYYLDIVDVCAKTPGLFPSVTMAQMIEETGWGESHLFKNCNNGFGIKKHNWQGSVCYANDDAPNEAFRKYDNVRQSIEDHSYFLITNPRYANVFTATTPEQQAYELKAAGYATNSQYANKLISIINDNNLKKLDFIPTTQQVTANDGYVLPEVTVTSRSPFYDIMIMGVFATVIILIKNKL